MVDLCCVYDVVTSSLRYTFCRSIEGINIYYTNYNMIIKFTVCEKQFKKCTTKLAQKLMSLTLS